MQTSVDIGGSETLTLKGAMLLYSGRRSFVTWHQVLEAPGGAPILGEAQSLTMEFVRALSQSLGTHAPAEILPDNVLVRTAETIVWWTPATHRTMFFRTTDEVAQPLSGKRFPHPPLVWRVSGHELWVRAIKEDVRPSAETSLFVAPYWNVNGQDGLTCQGSMHSPEESGVGSIGQWERAFFQSEFTHATGVHRLISHTGGCLGLWTSLIESAKPFPVRQLIPAKQTLRQFVQEQ